MLAAMQAQAYSGMAQSGTCGAAGFNGQSCPSRVQHLFLAPLKGLPGAAACICAASSVFSRPCGCL